MKMRVSTMLWIAAACIAAPAFAGSQPVPLFSDIKWNSAPLSPPIPDALEIYYSTIDIPALAAMPEQVRVQIPRPHGGAIDIVVSLEASDRRDGFVQRDGWSCHQGDPVGCELIPIPNLPADQFSYRWSGRGDGYELRINIHRGHVIGIVAGAAGRFALSREVVKELRMEYFRLDDPVGTSATTDSGTRDGDVADRTVPVMSVTEANAATLMRISPQPLSPMGPSSTPRMIDMVVLFTEQGRIAAGGNPAVCSDTGGIIGLIQNGIGDINDAFRNSAIDARVGVVTVSKLAGWEPVPYAGSWDYGEALQSRNQIQASPSIKAYRNAVGADIVAVIPASQATFGPCGVAYVQRSECASQGIATSPCTGVNFSEYTYYLSTAECSSSADVFTHELGHVLGAEHNRGAGAAADHEASFPFAFGYSNTPWFQTVMAQNFSPSAPVRILQFSNPGVLSGGRPTGTTTMNNALAISNLADGVAALRSRPSIIFASGFDSSAACPSITYVPGTP